MNVSLFRDLHKQLDDLKKEQKTRPLPERMAKIYSIEDQLYPAAIEDLKKRISSRERMGLKSENFKLDLQLLEYEYRRKVSGRPQQKEARHGKAAAN